MENYKKQDFRVIISFLNGYESYNYTILLSLSFSIVQNTMGRDAKQKRGIKRDWYIWQRNVVTVCTQLINKKSSNSQQILIINIFQASPIVQLKLDRSYYIILYYILRILITFYSKGEIFKNLKLNLQITSYFYFHI